jgi:hypothetical protein
MAKWLMEGLIPAGTVATIADKSDGTPEEVLARGFDVVIHFDADEGAPITKPALVTVLWRDGLVDDAEPPAPFWVRFTGAGFERLDVNGGHGGEESATDPPAVA